MVILLLVQFQLIELDSEVSVTPSEQTTSTANLFKTFGHGSASKEPLQATTSHFSRQTHIFSKTSWEFGAWQVPFWKLPQAPKGVPKLASLIADMDSLVHIEDEPRLRGSFLFHLSFLYASFQSLDGAQKHLHKPSILFFSLEISSRHLHQALQKLPVDFIWVSTNTIAVLVDRSQVGILGIGRVQHTCTHQATTVTVCINHPVPSYAFSIDPYLTFTHISQIQGQ